MISFSSDIDWAPEMAIRDFLSIFQSYGIPCNLFCTHPSKEIYNCDRDLFEIGIHPNFNSQLLEGKAGRPVDEIIQELLGWYPEAKAVRSHTLTQNSTLLSRFAAAGMIYEANMLLPYDEDIKIHKNWTGMWRIPYNWEDDVHWAYGKSFADLGMAIDGKGLYILNFHPIHVFLNTDCDATYQAAKAHYKDADKLLEFRNTKVPGTRDLLFSVLDKIKNENLPVAKLSQLVAPGDICSITHY